MISENDDVPILSILKDDDLEGVVAIDDYGNIDFEETVFFLHLICSGQIIPAVPY
jgi:hypothetical protein